MSQAIPRFSIKRLRTAEKPKQLTFGDGIPHIDLAETGPSHCDNDHPAVEFQEKSFGLLSQDIFKCIQGNPSGISTIHGQVARCFSNDIAGLVKTFVFHILSSLGYAGDFEVHFEVGTFTNQRDLLMISKQGVPVGVIQVTQRSSALSHPNALGELFDFVKHLPNYHGVHPVFGILTNFQSWRIAWLPDETTDSLAAKSIEFDEASDDEGVTGEIGENASAQPIVYELRQTPTASRIYPIVHAVEEESTSPTSINIDEQDDMIANTMNRFLHVSKIFHRTDPETMLAVCSAIVKMCAATISSFSSPFDKGKKRSWSTIWVKCDQSKKGNQQVGLTQR